MTTNNSILVDNVRSNKSDNMVWAVYAQGNEQAKSCPNIHDGLSGSILFTITLGIYSRP